MHSKIMGIKLQTNTEQLALSSRIQLPESVPLGFACFLVTHNCTLEGNV
ncbi:hypothetical protein LEMLEM_LOCUS15118, partial [Lemmus lemmus]